MDAGLIKRADYFALRVSPSSASYSGIGGVFVASTTSYYRSFSNPHAIGIALTSTYAPPGVYDLRVTIPDIGLSWSLPGQVAGDIEVRVYGNIYSFGSFWVYNITAIEIWANGVLDTTWTPGGQTSALTGLWPSTIPLIGIAPIIAAGATTPAPDFWTGGSGSGGASGTATGGYKWVVDGVDEIISSTLPGTLITPPGVACATGAGTLPSVSSSDTWTNTATAYVSASWTFTTFDSESRSSWVQPVPTLPRRYRRIGTDYGALPIRYSLPLAQQHGQSECRAHTPPGAPAVLTVDNNSTVIVARATLKDYVESAAHVFEDALNDVPKALFHREVTVAHQDWNSTGYTFSGSRKDTSEFTGAESPSADYVAGLVTSSDTTRYWDLLVNPHWSHKLFFKDWAARGALQDPRLYWCPIRQQWCSVDGVTAALRNNVVLDALKSNSAWHDSNYAVGIRNLGATRFQVYDVTPWTSYTYSSGSSSLWTFGDCSASFGASDIVLTPSTADIFAELDLGSFDLAPYMAVHFADHLKLTWDSANITAITWSLVGIDGTKTTVAAASGVSLAKPRGTSIKYSGSWAIDNGNGQFTQIGADTGPHSSDGISALTMADKERIHAFLLAPGSTYAKLRVDIKVTDPLVTCKFSYPEFTRSEGTDPDLIWESGQVCDLIYKDNAGVRFGNAYWYDGALLASPSVRGLGLQQSALDGLVNSRIWFTAQAKDDGLDSQIAGLWDSFEGQTQAKADQDTAAVILPDPGWGRIQYALLNELAEVPPLALCPRKERDSDWQETGSWCLDSWSWCVRSQRYVTPGATEFHLKTPDDVTTLTSVEAGYVSGWKVTERHDAVDNTEGDDYLVKYGGEERAQVSPWVGYFAIFGLTETGGPVSYDVSFSMRHARAYVKDGVVWVGTGSNSPLPIAFLDRATSIAADSICLRWNLNSISQQLFLASESGGSIRIFRSTDLFATWTTSPFVLSGTKPAICVSDAGRLLVYWRAASGDISGRIFDQNLTVIETTFTVTACDDEGLSCYEQPTAGGGREVVLLYISGGNVYRATSKDGKTFGAGTLVAAGKKPMSFRGEAGKHSEAWIDGSDLKVRTVDRQGVQILTPNVVGSADNAQSDIAQSVGDGGQLRFVVLYNDSSSLTQKYSFDSNTWT